MIKVKVQKKKQFRKYSNAHPERTEELGNTYVQTVDIREKRIGIVFKVIYVVAIFFAAMFVMLPNGANEGLTDLYIVEVGVTTLPLVVLFYMGVYILNELKCLKLFARDLPQKQVDETENSYSNIFLGLQTSGIVVFLIVVTLTYIKGPWLTTMVVGYTFVTAMILQFVLTCVAKWLNAKNAVIEVVQCILGTVMVMCVLLLPAVNAMENVAQ